MLNIFRDRLINSLTRYLSTFGESGICEGGVSYWNYGFSNYIYFADMLKEHTNGRFNILNIHRAETVSTYGCNAYIRKDHTISYSDGSHSFHYNIGLNHFLADTYEKAYPLDPAFAAKILPSFFKDAIRTLIWTNPDYLDTKELPMVISEEYDNKVGWYINKKVKYSFTTPRNTVNEHFISYAKPEICGNVIAIGETTLICPSNCQLNVMCEQVRPHIFREELQNFKTIYNTEVIFECGKEFNAEFIIKIN